MDRKRETELLLCHVLQKSRAYVLARPELKLTKTQNAELTTLLKRREQGEPMAYLIGKRGFWKHDFEVTPATLIPRPETELIIETALQHLETGTPARILDLGTGSGIIAISLALESPFWQVVAVDASLAALEIARKNARLLQALNVSFLESNWFSALADQFHGNQKGFDLIVANPPYIAEQDPHLTQGDLRFEPQDALSSGPDGLKDLRTIIREAPYFLKHEGFLMVEHGYDQHTAVQQLLWQAGFSEAQTLNDLNGHPRTSLGRWRQP